MEGLTVGLLKNTENILGQEVWPGQLKTGGV